MKKKTWRTLLVWACISLVLQFVAYAYINEKVKSVMAPPEVKPITQQISADIPGVDLKNVQLSYAKDYLAYTQDGVLKVYNLKQNKLVFTKAPLPGSAKNMGVLNYEWLPDRNTLIYFFARKNPNPVVTTVVPSSGNSPATTNPKPGNTNSPGSTTSPSGSNSQTSGKSSPAGVQQGSAPQTQQGTSAAGQTKSNATGTSGQVLPKTEDPNEQAKPAAPNPVPTQPQPQPKVEIRKSNPQLTDLYTLEFPESDDLKDKPDDRFNQTLTNFPAGGEIVQMAFSTYTNLMYITIKAGNTTELLEIDVMKNVRTINRSGEQILGISASERNGTLYVESKSGGKKQILAVDGYKRKLISGDPDMEILGNRAGILYLGEVKNGILTKILTLTESPDLKENPALKTIWLGSLEFENRNVQIGTEQRVILYDAKAVDVIKDGKDRTIELHGDASYVSVDGAELMELNRQGETTHVELRPLE